MKARSLISPAYEGAASTDATASVHAHASSYQRPKILRRNLKAGLVAEQKLGRKEDGLSQPQLSLFTEIDRSYITRCELEHEEHHSPSALHIASAQTDKTRNWARRLIRWQAAAHRMMVIDAPALVHGTDNIARLAACTRTGLDLLASFADLATTDKPKDEQIEDVVAKSRAATESFLELEHAMSLWLQRRRSSR